MCPFMAMTCPITAMTCPTAAMAHPIAAMPCPHHGGGVTQSLPPCPCVTFSAAAHVPIADLLQLPTILVRVVETGAAVICGDMRGHGRRTQGKRVRADMGTWRERVSGNIGGPGDTCMGDNQQGRDGTNGREGTEGMWRRGDTQGALWVVVGSQRGVWSQRGPSDDIRGHKVTQGDTGAHRSCSSCRL